MDWPQILEIDVTQADLDAGQPGAVCGCAIALAAQRHFPDCAVFLGQFNLEIRSAGEIAGAVYHGSPAALHFRRHFDQSDTRDTLRPTSLRFELYTLPVAGKGRVTARTPDVPGMCSTEIL